VCHIFTYGACGELSPLDGFHLEIPVDEGESESFNYRRTTGWHGDRTEAMLPGSDQIGSARRPQDAALGRAEETDGFSGIRTETTVKT